MIALTQAGRDFLRDSGRMAPSSSRAAPSREERWEETRR
jgi:hypothetical protein